MKRPWQIKFLIVLCCLIYSFVSSFSFQSQVGCVRVIFLDVGQGDSLLLITPDNKSLLIDTGPDISATSGIAKYWQGNYLDYVIITHPDNDHAGGLYDLERSYKILNFIAENQSEYDAQKQITISENEILNLGCCVTLKFMNTNSEAKDSNDRSIAIEITDGKNDIFVAGDLPSEIEDGLSQKLGDIEILKLGHHGSKTSTSSYFLEQVKPEYAVISVGKDNKYGHPHKLVLQNIAAINAKILRTDIIGDVVFEFDSNRIWQITTD